MKYNPPRIEDSIITKIRFRDGTYSEVFLNNPNKIAVIDDDQAVRDATQCLLQSLGYETSGFASAQEFLSCRDIETICCIISDVRMPGMSGPELQQVLIANSIQTQ
jgi:FixJ family two-component response regulator